MLATLSQITKYLAVSRLVAICLFFVPIKMFAQEEIHKSDRVPLIDTIQTSHPIIVITDSSKTTIASAKSMFGIASFLQSQPGRH